MTDNYVGGIHFPSGLSGVETFASDDVGGVHYKIIKLAHGALDAVTLVSTASGLPVNIVADGVGIGGGTQYTEPATDASITGTVAMMEAAADAVVPLQGTAADGLLVNLGANNDVTYAALLTELQLKADLTETQPVSLGSVPSHAVTNGAIDGPGAPTIDSYTHLAVNLAAAADQQLVAAPGASKQIWVYALHLVLSAAGTISFQDSDNAAYTGIMPYAANSGPGQGPSGNFAMPLWKGNTNKNLEIDIVTAEVDGWIDYAVVSV